MTNILEDFYYGKINPLEKRFDNIDGFAKCVKIASDNEAALFSSLDDISLKRMQNLLKAHTDISEITTREYFIEGFCLGAKFLAAAFTYNESGDTV